MQLFFPSLLIVKSRILLLFDFLVVVEDFLRVITRLPRINPTGICLIQLNLQLIKTLLTNKILSQINAKNV